MGPKCWILSQLFHSPLSLSSRGSLVLFDFLPQGQCLSAYLRLLIFLTATLIPAFASSSLAFHMKYSAYKLNKQGDNTQPWRTPFPVWTQSVDLWQFLSAASWLAYKFLMRQVTWSGIPISLRISYNLSWFSVRGFSIINEAEVDVFLEFPCFLYDPVNVGNLISDPSAFSKPTWYIWKSSVHIQLKSSLKDFDHYFASMWNEYNHAVAWAFFGIVLLWDRNENWPFQVLWPLLSFPNLLTYWHFNSIIF